MVLDRSNNRQRAYEGLLGPYPCQGYRFIFLCRPFEEASRSRLKGSQFSLLGLELKHEAPHVIGRRKV